MRVVTHCGRECLVRRQSPVPTFTLDLKNERSSSWPQCQVESKYFPLQRCESRLLPTHSRGFPTTIITACWCFQDELFKVTWKHLRVVDLKIKPLRSQYVKCYLCKSKQGILIYFFFSNDLAFRKIAKFQRLETFPPASRERGYLLLQVSQRTRQGHPGRRGQFPVTAKKQSLTWLGSADLQPWPSDPTSYLTTGRGWVARYLQKGPGTL